MRRDGERGGGSPLVVAHLVERRALSRVMLLALSLFWAGFVAIYTAKKLLTFPGEILHGMVPRIVISLVGATLSWLMHLILERFRAASLARRVLSVVIVSLPVATLFSVCDTGIAVYLTPDFSSLCNDLKACTWFDIWTLEVGNIITWLFVFAAWGMLDVVLRTGAEVRIAQELARAEREAAQLAEIRALRYQINPHFLYNCLNSLHALVRRHDTGPAEEMIDDLGRFIRFSLTVDPLVDVTLDSEMEMQRRYLELERRRFPQRLVLDVRVDAEVADAAVPSLLLQPLVENAVKHGVNATQRPVVIKVRAVRLGTGQVQVMLSNETDGPTRPAARRAAGFGIGLANVAARLKARYGGGATLTAGPVEPDGFRVELVFPLEGVRS